MKNELVKTNKILVELNQFQGFRFFCFLLPIRFNFFVGRANLIREEVASGGVTNQSGRTLRAGLFMCEKKEGNEALFLRASQSQNGTWK